MEEEPKPKKAMIYTKTGDKGTTSLYSGERKNKSDLEFHVLGKMDTLSSYIGLAISFMEIHYKDKVMMSIFRAIQNDLLNFGSNVATTNPKKRVELEKIRLNVIESEIDNMDAKLPPLKEFILPGGHIVAAHVHICRVSARECERYYVEWLLENDQDEDRIYILKYLNRLSDYMFTVARFVNWLMKVDTIKKNKLPE